MPQKQKTIALLGAAVAMLALPLELMPRAQSPDAERFWPKWRGPSANGFSRHANPPTEWSETRNIRWKVEIPGRGSASPVIWGNRLFLLTAVPAGVTGAAAHAPLGGARPRPVHRFVVMAINRADGSISWERTAREEAPHEASHQENGTWASSSAITDGQHVIAYFESRGLYVYDMEGKLVWQKDLGDKSMRNQFGEGSTPALHGNTLVVVWDHTAGSYVVALDKLTGKELWRIRRDEEIDTWATPLIVEHAGRAQVIVPGKIRLHSYDLESGKIVWFSDGLTMNAIPSPVGADGMIFATSGFQGNSLKAVRLADATGEISGSKAIVWSLNRDTPYVPSPLLYDGFLYFIKSNSPILSAFDSTTGKPHYQAQRLDGLGEVFSSPVGAGGRVYLTDRNGTTLVIRNAGKFEVLAKNVLDDGFDASPALVDNELYLRGFRYLYSIGAK